ncbi:hypothetical protein GUITHDRAFT_132448 [Guillardia theta CCMP2712]|uniref:Uncharacterized protein n=1 Tax=Guillardia theta (strain CCMP2712) TaxID=905079 RepID=L1K081_GUITC|nr:hypothetical protein GUITHDRAFT_132448 [Guillardia theta CCMP2712]EKX54032.1 hypothetical protein GUITHDRAFT_132448 [Guillardia theta CCMP2712]|mmetsp:Transcript_32863/g.103921  ORF Transcript_32863/g.103921 Transcript_32863/m.103921 type:complete len:194 (-) Transcript_32863:141-722(-)|eukprot:XP_005841012.1 hypothetical protein GUITHDRAFT_132448 [Guillardia theta CCMP2712]
MRAAYSVAFVVSGSMLFLVVVLLIFGVRQPGHHAPLQTARSSVEELREDVSEVEAFAEASRRSGVVTLLLSYREKLLRQIDKQEEWSRKGDRMLSEAYKDMTQHRFDQARVSLAGARSAFSRAAATKKLVQVDAGEATLSREERNSGNFSSIKTRSAASTIGEEADRQHSHDLTTRQSKKELSNSTTQSRSSS